MPLVTRIIAQKRRPNRRNVYLDGQFAFGCHLNVVARFHLREGISLSPEQVDAIRMGEVYQECFDKALEFLSHRLHSRKELLDKLSRQEYGEGAVDAVLEELTRLGYVDDRRFACTLGLAAAGQKHFGRRRTLMQLLKKGVALDIANEALNEVYREVDSAVVARELAMKHAARLRRLAPAVARRRLVGLLQRRGFEYDAIRPILDQVLGTGEGGDAAFPEDP